jgi:hypothetical protein
MIPRVEVLALLTGDGPLAAVSTAAGEAPATPAPAATVASTTTVASTSRGRTDGGEGGVERSRERVAPARGFHRLGVLILIAP